MNFHWVYAIQLWYIYYISCFITCRVECDEQLKSSITLSQSLLKEVWKESFAHTECYNFLSTHKANQNNEQKIHCESYREVHLFIAYIRGKLLF